MDRREEALRVAEELMAEIELERLKPRRSYSKPTASRAWLGTTTCSGFSHWKGTATRVTAPSPSGSAAPGDGRVTMTSSWSPGSQQPPASHGTSGPTPYGTRVTNALDAGVPLRDARILARHADPAPPSTTTAPAATSTDTASTSSPHTSPASDLPTPPSSKPRTMRVLHPRQRRMDCGGAQCGTRCPGLRLRVWEAALPAAGSAPCRCETVSLLAEDPPLSGYRIRPLFLIVFTCY
jgi:hypothetical protein